MKKLPAEIKKGYVLKVSVGVIILWLLAVIFNLTCIA